MATKEGFHWRDATIVSLHSCVTVHKSLALKKEPTESASTSLERARRPSKLALLIILVES
jgi:hypothetical protein